MNPNSVQTLAESNSDVTTDTTALEVVAIYHHNNAMCCDCLCTFPLVSTTAKLSTECLSSSCLRGSDKSQQSVYVDK